MQRRLTHNLKYVNWCRLSPETQINSTDCPTNKTRLDTLELHQFIIRCQGFLKLSSNASDNPVNCRTHSSGISLYNIRRKTFFILSFISVAQNVAQFVKHKVVQQHSVGTSDHGLSVYRLLSVTGHQSSVNRPQKLPLLYQSVKTLAVHCHSDICSAPRRHYTGCGNPGSVYSTMPQWGHLMLLQYVAARSHLPSVSTANINTMQYPKPYQQSQLLWYPRCCFLSPTSWQPLFIATAVSCLMSLQACQNTTIMSHNTPFYSVRTLAADPLILPLKISNYQHTTIYLFSQCLTARLW